MGTNKQLSIKQIICYNIIAHGTGELFIVNSL